jgi:hypothetical protein
VIWIFHKILSDVSNAFVRDLKHRKQCVLGFRFAAGITAEGALGIDLREMAARV